MTRDAKVRTGSLPFRIAAVMASTILVLALTLAISVAWMARAFDRSAREASVEAMRASVAGLLGQIGTTTLDYAKWDEAARRVAAGDEAWTYSNIGSAVEADMGIGLVIVRGEGFPGGVGWDGRSGDAGRPDLLAPEDVAWLDEALDPVPMGAARAVTRFVRRGDQVLAVATARIEPLLDTSQAAADAQVPRLVMGLPIDEAVIAALVARTVLTGVSLTAGPPPDGMALALPGPRDAPVGFVSWDAPAPGRDLLLRLLLPFAAMAAVAGALAAAGVLLARRSAQALVRAEAASATAARTDALTGLPNRAAFREMMELPAGAGERALVALDLNGFQRINDSLGQAAGDAVIVEVAARLDRLRDEGCRLARIDSDEFVFVMTGPGAERHAAWMAGAVERVLRPPLAAMGHQLRVGAAIGWAAQGDEGTPGDVLVHRANLAMAEAKRRHRGAGGAAATSGRLGAGATAGVVAWDTMIEKADHDARAIEVGLRDALACPGQIRVAYQPIVEVGSGRMVRAEALARWTSPTLGVVPPDRFVAVAERSGLMTELGRRILDLVCDDLAAWPGLSAAINVSPRGLVAPAFVSELVGALGRRGIDPARLEVELTEQVVVDEPELAARCLRELHAAGVSIALDDFGTGFSSIGTLTRMEFDVVKIDRSFVSGFPGEPRRLALLSAMIQTAHALGLRVVCEGIEEADEMGLLPGLGCDMAQGWHLDRPMPIEALAARWLVPAAWAAARAEVA